jgi:hypothetical protein
VTEFKEYVLPDYYDTTIENIIGRLVLLYGQIDRLLIKVIQEKSNPKIDIKAAIAIVRQNNNGHGMMLGAWINWLSDNAVNYGIAQDWSANVIAYINAMKPIRDQIIHDSLMLNEYEKPEWKTNQSKSQYRDHKNFEMAELVSALNTFYAFKQFIFSSIEAKT